jgi:hypothetical protein
MRKRYPAPLAPGLRNGGWERGGMVRRWAVRANRSTGQRRGQIAICPYSSKTQNRKPKAENRRHNPYAGITPVGRRAVEPGGARWWLRRGVFGSFHTYNAGAVLTNAGTWIGGRGKRKTKDPKQAGGEGGIRTLGGALGHLNRLAGGPIRPLWHLPWCVGRVS